MNVGIILGTNELSGLKYAAIEAGMRTSMDDRVIIFATMDGLLAFLKEPQVKVTTKTSEIIKQKDPDWIKLLKDAKEDGLLTIVACYYAADMYRYKKADFGELVDDIWGVSKFTIETDDAQMISVW